MKWAALISQHISRGLVTSLRFAGFYVDMTAITIMTRHIVTGLRPISSDQVDKQSQSRLYTFQKEVRAGYYFSQC